MTDLENDPTPAEAPDKLSGAELEELDSLEGLKEQAALRGVDVSGLRSKDAVRGAILAFDIDPEATTALLATLPDERTYRLRDQGTGHVALEVGFLAPAYGDGPDVHTSFTLDDQWRELPDGLDAADVHRQAASVGLVIEHRDPEGD